MKIYAVLVAGGTGGHINAAIALGERLEARGHDVKYLTGERPLDYKLFANRNVSHLPSWPLRTKNPFKLLQSLLKNFFVFVRITKEFARKKPRFVVGAGGYVCGPTLLAARIQGIPVFIFEQNAYMGLTNKLLTPLSRVVFAHFKNTMGVPDLFKDKLVVVGNPTRSAIAYVQPRIPNDETRILVFGGSLGAKQINDLIGEWVQRDHSSKVHVIHQTGLDTQPQFAAGRNVTYTPMKYLDNIQQQYEWCDVLVTRAGASTVSELRIVRKPCFIIPFPRATDNHQWWNALEFREESDFSVEVVDPKLPRLEMAGRLDAFLGQAITHQLRASQSGAVAVDSGELALREIFKHAGIV
jgi:UDP-N-acetylglucosamine--N-acetylmuramyl-(pentapeptide) pyrophosphoryl-undecaprenol N-acetylglucosamine transferase